MCFFTTFKWQNCSFFHDVHFRARKDRFILIKSISNYLFRLLHQYLLISIFLYSVFNERCDKAFALSLVGSSGLEPPTLRLSGARSNHLSYEPISLVCFFGVGVVFPLPHSGGDEGIRTLDPLLARQVLSQLSYGPTKNWCLRPESNRHGIATTGF